MQNLVNAAPSQQNIIVKNQLFHYPNPYPSNLPPLDSDKYDPKHHDSSDILSPRLPQRNMPMLSDGHRPNNYTPHSKPSSQVPQSSLGDSFTKRGSKMMMPPQDSTMPSLFQHGGSGLNNRAIHVNLSNPGMLKKKPMPQLPRLSTYLQY